VFRTLWGVVTLWGVAAGLYGVVLAFAALTQPIRRRNVAFAASLAYALAAIGAGTLVENFWINLFVPGALLLIGYWLCGLYFRAPQAWLEQWLLRIDHRCGAERWMSALPRPIAELLELSYALDYVVVGGGAIYAATFGLDAVTSYWALVLTAELASFAPLPWLRSRPPRAIEAVPGTRSLQFAPKRGRSGRPPYLRRLNTAILDNASVQANTLPSGHVSGAVAAALAIWTFDPAVGTGLLGMAGAIAIAAIAGRYHYVVDCVAGAAVAAAFSSLM
jgi:hypothetical protein